MISTVGFEQPGDQRVHSVTPDVVDEHYYRTVETFLKMARGQYENYDRKGPKIFVGEWGAYETPFEPWNPRSRGEAPTPNMRAALGDAAFMTADGEERRHRRHELLRAAAGQRQSRRAAVAAEPDRLRRAARLRLAELPRDQDVQHAPRRRDPEGERRPTPTCWSR